MIVNLNIQITSGLFLQNSVYNNNSIFIILLVGNYYAEDRLMIGEGKSSVFSAAKSSKY